MKIGVVGLGSFGSHLVRELAELGVEVLAVDSDEACVDAVKNDAAFAAVLDVTDREALERLPLKELDAVIVTIGDNFRSAMLVTAHLLHLKPRRLVCRAGSPTHGQLLRALGIEELIEPEAVAAAQVAMSLAFRGVRGSYELAEGYSILQVTAPAWVVGRTLGDLDLRQEYQVNLVTVKRHDGGSSKDAVVGVLGPEFIFIEGDVLVLFGAEERLRKFIAG
jgi:trk system potassium uptake protein